VRIAVLADVHANRIALAAVLAEADRRGAARLVCLGDFVGYYAQPNECIELLADRGAEGVIGNHDLGALGVQDPLASRAASEMQAWTAGQLTPASVAFLRALPPRREFAWGSAVHGCFINPRHSTGYITATMAASNLACLSDGRAGGRVGLFGHTHMPAVYCTQWESDLPASGTLQLPRNGVALANPGAVGQPRDGDPRAAFALLDLEDWTLEFLRVPYDVDEAVRLMLCAGVDPTLAERLRIGR